MELVPKELPLDGPFMSSPLSKSDLCWVLVRLAGVYFVYLGLSGLFTAFISWATIRELDLLTSAQLAPANASINGLIARSLLPLAIGAYLLKSGELLYRCLMFVPVFQPAARNSRELAPGIVLANHEIEAFHTWLEQHPEFQNRPLVDQIALFRDDWGKGPKS